MARPASRHPTELELAILKILWRDGPATVRTVREKLHGSRDRAYTSVMTVMNIMTEKRYLTRVMKGGSYIYRPRIKEAATTRRMLHDLVDRAFDGSATALMLDLLETKEIDAAELKQLRALIDGKARRKSP